jgi:arylsulfatase A-like enzyme
MKPTRRNLLFLMTDQQRADTLGMRQCGREVTPNLNALAGESAVFRRAYTTCPLGVPARTALVTGLYPTANGVVYNDWACLRAGDCTPIHQHLSRLGYRLGHVGTVHVALRPGLLRRVPFDLVAGADRFQAPPISDADGAEASDPVFRSAVEENIEGDRFIKHYANTRTAASAANPAQIYDSWLVEQALAFLHKSTRQEHPWALFLWLRVPKPPLVVPEPYFSRFDPEAIDLPDNVGRASADEPASRRRSPAAQLARGVDEAQWRRVWSAYLGLCSLADDLLGKVLLWMREQRQMDRTVLVMTSDHGEHLGQHAMYQKMEMYEPALRVPLLVADRHLGPARIDTPVSHLDVLPTLSELMGLGIEDKIDGVSLVSALRSGQSEENSSVFAQYSGNPAIGDLRRAVISNRYKYVIDGDGQRELYDLVSDPLEMENLATSVACEPTMNELHQQAAQWGQNHGDWFDF